MGRRIQGARTALAVAAGTLAVAAPGAGAETDAANFGGGRAFFTTPIPAGSPIDARSAQWITGLGRPTPYLNGPDNRFAPPVYSVNSHTPKRTVHCLYCGAYTGTGPTQYANRFEIPIPDGADPDPSEDGHIAFVDHATGDEWDLINAKLKPDGSWHAGGAGHFTLHGDGHQDNLLGGGSATASHLPLAEAVSAAEMEKAIADGTFLLPHALSFGAPNIDGRCWVYPALGSDGGVTGGLPEGARIQLDPAFDVSHLAPPARVLARTLQVYGAYLRDLSGTFVLYLRPHRGHTTTWQTIGLDGDSLSGVPTDRLRVLATDFTTLGTTQPFVQRPAADCGPGATNVEPDRSAEGRPGVTPTGTTAPGTSTGTAPASGHVVSTGEPKAKAPTRLHVKHSGRSVQIVWSSVEPGRHYRVLIDGRVRATTNRTHTGLIKMKKGRHHVLVQATTAFGTIGEKTAPVSFTVR